MSRALSTFVAITLVISPTVATAQQRTQSYEFLEAVRKGDGDKVTDFLNQPGQLLINSKDRSSGDGALHIVTSRNDAVYLRFLLAKGADPNIQDANGNTPAMLAVEKGFTEGLDSLIRYKANLNLGNARGETPLIRAVQLRRTDLVRTLLDGGANPDQADILAGLSARDYARRDTRTPALLKLMDEAPKAKKPVIAGPRL
ncbi:ankyrin repeat domain-containing protein [Sphingomonas sp. PL-96]|uniref:ankyrin repeat domain-containing protein n=1 Tax=Sphingomonas sp. PL-96 TaxID=2887201 RepID=UPI001E44C361|nr:ankyrin repeat domain-containing protein [Sphingomonas sp. PL-96]MCC2977657.1 ankyrin repeat domain-containing protein [Sphingomonas sp. PL-96]